MRNRSLVIGAGSAGMVSARLLKEDGDEVVLLERSNYIGGVWSDEGASWSGMLTNVSKFTDTFTDYYMPDEYPLFPERGLVYEYLLSFATEHNLLEDIQLNCEVLSVEQGEEEGVWRARWMQDGEEHVEEFSRVIVAVGKLNTPYYPVEKSVLEEAFSGRVEHAANFSPDNDYEGKTVVIVGGNLSGIEIAEILALNETVNLIHIVSTPSWCEPRLKAPDPNFPEVVVPRDLVNIRSGENAANDRQKSKKSNQTMPGTCSRQSNPSHPLHIPEAATGVRVAVSDSYLDLYEAGKFTIVRGRFTGAEGHLVHHKSILGENEVIADVDVIICCTGFSCEIPFLDEEFKRELNYCSRGESILPLFKGVIPPWRYRGIAFVGLQNKTFFIKSELQARIAIFCMGDNFSQYPSEDEIEQEANGLLAARVQSPLLASTYLPACDDYAHYLGMMPEISQVEGWPAIPAHYQLNSADKRTRERAVAQSQKALLLLRPSGLQAHSSLYSADGKASKEGGDEKKGAGLLV